MLIYYKTDCISDVYGRGVAIECFDTVNKCFIYDIHEEILESFALDGVQCIVAESPINNNMVFHFALQYLRYADKDSYNKMCAFVYRTQLDCQPDKIMYEYIFDRCNEDVELFLKLYDEYIKDMRHGYYYVLK